MTTLTLLTKTNNDTQLKQIERTLNFLFKGLEVETRVIGTVADRWVQIAIAGEDEGIATNYLIKEIGLCPSTLENVRGISTLKGYIKNTGKIGGLLIDIGVFQPKIVLANITLRDLQAQLMDGRKIALRKIAELFGLCEDFPLSVEIFGIDKKESRIDAKLSSQQTSNFTVWRESLLDRLVVLGSSLYEVNKALRHAKLERDVIDVEPLGLLEHALTCKLGTDAAGLIPKIGRTLKSARFTVFNPKALRKLYV